MNNYAVPWQRIKLYLQFIKHFWRNYAKTWACKLVIRKLLNSTPHKRWRLAFIYLTEFGFEINSIKFCHTRFNFIMLRVRFLARDKRNIILTFSTPPYYRGRLSSDFGELGVQQCVLDLISSSCNLHIGQ